MSDTLKILPLGGLGEVGMNCLLLECQNDIVLIDCGLQFPDVTYPGVEILVPDLSYVLNRLDKIRGVIVTHGHEDHIGAIPFLLRETDLDIWATPFPEGLLRQKLAEFQPEKEARFHPIEVRKKFKVGCFTFDPIPVQHSIIEALAFAIETPVGVLIHSGDFKHDPQEQSRGEITFQPFHEYGEKGVLLLMSDSTNAEREGHTISEIDVEKTFDKILDQQKGRLIIALFASNIRRVERLMSLAHQKGKKIAFVGRSMHSYTRLAFEQNNLNIPADTVILAENTHNFPDDQVIILATGSQAEPRSALVRISEGMHKDFTLKPGDWIVMSSKFIPGNEKAITRMIDNLYRAGADVMYESAHQIHVSGHGFQEELLMMLNAAKPKYFVPIHGEYRHLAKHGKLAEKSGVLAENIHVIEDGQILEVSAKGVRRGEKLEMQKLPAVENLFVDGSPEALGQRVKLSRSGIVFVALLRNNRSKKLIADPIVEFHGLLLFHGQQEAKVAEAAQKRLAQVNAKYQDRDDMEEVLRLEVRRFFRKHASNKPIVVPMIIDIDV